MKDSIELEYIKNLETTIYLVAKERLSHQSIFQLLNDNLPLSEKNNILKRILSIARNLYSIKDEDIQRIKEIRSIDLNSDI